MKYLLVILLAIILSGCAVLLGMSVGVFGAAVHRQERVDNCVRKCYNDAIWEKGSTIDCKKVCNKIK